MYKVFIDGQVGTTGLQIVQRLQQHENIELIEIPANQRKDNSIKQDYLNQSDLVILCLPDDAAKESVGLITNPHVRVLDASTAHRTNPSWTYGLPELSGDQRGKIKKSRFVSVPGCYATAFILAVAPLVRAGLIPPDYPISFHAVSGYSGGGKKLIEAYQNRESIMDVSALWPFRPYALQMKHKHLPEMQYYSGILQPPLFVPAVGHFYQGMLVMIPLIKSLLSNTVHSDSLINEYQKAYENEPFIRIIPANDSAMLENGYLNPTACNGTNLLELTVFGNDEQYLLVARLDNLGKGASGAAVQNLNLMFGIEETSGLL